MNGLCSSASGWQDRFAAKFAGYPEGEDRAEEAIPFAAMDCEASASSFAKRLFQRLRDFFRAIATLFRGPGFDTPESIFGKIDEAQFGERLRARSVDAPGAGRHVAGIRGSGWANWRSRGPLLKVLSSALRGRRAKRWTRLVAVAPPPTENLIRVYVVGSKELIGNSTHSP